VLSSSSSRCSRCCSSSSKSRCCSRLDDVEVGVVAVVLRVTVGVEVGVVALAYSLSSSSRCLRVIVVDDATVLSDQADVRT